MTDLCHQERASIVAVVTNLLMNGYVLFGHLGLSGDGALDGADATMLWAKMVVWAIPGFIGLTIVLNVVFALASKGRVSGSTMDERDRMFRLRGMSATTIIFGLGFVASLVGLSLGWKPLNGIILIYVSATVGDLIGNLVRLAGYRLSA
ncbi:MAG: hypothetical protein ACI9X4_000023 [Glaciecola sp.]|jgi:hypothetical protein